MSKTALVFGGSGALGRTLISHFKSLSIVTINIDFTANPDASTNIKMESSDQMMSSLTKVLGPHSLDSIINVAGGWAGGNASALDLIEKTQLMFDQSVKSSVFAASIASKLLKESGLLVFVGASAALDPTPGMLAYGMAKASVHHLVRSLGASDSGLPKNAICTGICPVILDTPNNRKWMPKEDFSSWTPMQEIAHTWNSQDLEGIVIASNNQFWQCRVSDLKSPVGMDPLTFANLLKQIFLFDTSDMVIRTSVNDLVIDCNHTADGFTFTFASFRLEPLTGLDFTSFYRNAIMDLINENTQKTNESADLQVQIRNVEQVNAELEKEMAQETQKNRRDLAALTTVFKRIVNAKKSKIRALSERTIE